MKFLLFLLGISYFFIFFFLSNTGEDAFLVPLFLQAQIYIAGALFFIAYTLEMKKSHGERKNIFSHFSFNPAHFSGLIKTVLKENLYTLGIILLYASLYFISRGFFENLSLPYIFALVNIGVIILYFALSRSGLIYDIIRGNTIITSFFYSASHILLLFGFIDIAFLTVDYLNLGAVSILFMLLFSSGRSRKNAWIFATHGLVFFLLEISIFLYFVIPSEFFLQSIICALSVVIHLFFYGVDRLTEKTYIPSVFFLQIGNILSYILISLGVFILMGDVSISSFPVFMLTFLHACYLIRYYAEFRERGSLFFGFLGFLICFSFLIISFHGKDFLLLYSSFICLGISVFVYFFPFFKKYILREDIYIIHVFLLGVNILGVLLFFIYHEFSILHFGFLLLFEAGYFISNSYLFKKLYLPGNDL